MTIKLKNIKTERSGAIAELRAIERSEIAYGSKKSDR